MKRVFLVMFVSALLVTFGFTQTPDAGSNPAPASVKGCLGGSDGNFTVVEDGTGQIFKITSSTVDLKPHVGHDVKLVGHKATGAVSSGAADNSFSVNELSMISEHCAAAAAASSAAVTPSPETVITPDPVAPAAPAAASAPPAASAPAPDAAVPAETVSPAPGTASTPTPDAAPAAAVIPPQPAVSAPVVEAVPPATTVSPSVAPASAPVVAAARPERPSAHARKLSAKKAVAAAAAPAAAVSPSSDTVVPEAAETATPAAPAPSAEAAAPPDAAATTPAPAASHRAGSLTLLIGFVVLVIVLGTTAPLIGRWRKRKILERDGAPNLSFTNDESTSEVEADEASRKEASSDPGKPEPRKVA